MRSAFDPFYNDAATTPSTSAYTRSSMRTRGRGGVGGGIYSNSAAMGADEFAATFEHHHDIAEASRRARKERKEHSTHAIMHAQPLVQTVNHTQQQTTFHSQQPNDAPPTTSLSSLLAAASHRPSTSSFASGLSSGVSSSLIGSSSSSSFLRSSKLSSQLTASLAGTYAHFSSLLTSMDQFRYRAWIKDVRLFRTTAAAIWFSIVCIAVIHACRMSLPTSSQTPTPTTVSSISWSPLSWLYHLLVEPSPLSSHPFVTILFALIQSIHLILRANRAVTDPSPYYEPLLKRSWNVLTDVSGLSSLAISAALSMLEGWCVTRMLFSKSSLWNVTLSTESDAPVPVEATITFVVFGFITYVALHTIRNTEVHILQFPLVPRLSRTRLLTQRFAVVATSSIIRAAKLTFMWIAVWIVLGRTIVGSIDGMENIFGQTLADEGVTAATLVILPSLSAVYHLFLLFTCMTFASSLCTNFIDIFLTQLVDFEQFFLHALYAGTEHVQLPNTASMDQYGVDQSVVNSALRPHLGVSLQTTRHTYRALARSLNQLSNHAVLHWLIDLTSNPYRHAQRNRFLFQDDMNQMFVSNNTANTNNPSAEPSNLILPQQPGFVPVLVFALIQVRNLTERLAAHRILVSSPAVDEWHPSRIPSVGSVAGQNGIHSSLMNENSGGRFNGSDSATEIAAQTSVLTNDAFFATQLDGAGLWFPSRSQISHQLFSNASQVNLCVQIISELALHALRESGGEEDDTTTMLSGTINSRQTAASPFASAASQLTSAWLDTIFDTLLSLSLSLDQYVHSGHFTSPQQDRILQGHQMTRSVCRHTATVLDASIYRLVNSYREYLPELHLSTQCATRLQPYCSFGK